MFKRYSFASSAAPVLEGLFPDLSVTCPVKSAVSPEYGHRVSARFVELDLYALVIRENTSEIVSSSQTSTVRGDVALTESRGMQRMSFHLADLGADVVKVVVGVDSHGGALGVLSDATVALRHGDDGPTLISVYLEDHSKCHNSLLFGEFVRSGDGWKFRALLEGSHRDGAPAEQRAVTVHV